MKDHAWGMEVSIDLHECDPDLIRDAKKIEEFVIKLCKLIKVKRFSDPLIVNFGEDPRVSGYSLVQLIETSLVSAHFANQTNAAYLNVFSCKGFDPITVETFCKKFFKAETADSVVNFRR